MFGWCKVRSSSISLWRAVACSVRSVNTLMASGDPAGLIWPRYTDPNVPSPSRRPISNTTSGSHPLQSSFVSMWRDLPKNTGRDISGMIGWGLLGTRISWVPGAWEDVVLKMLRFFSVFLPLRLRIDVSVSRENRTREEPDQETILSWTREFLCRSKVRAVNICCRQYPKSKKVSISLLNSKEGEIGPGRFNIESKIEG